VNIETAQYITTMPDGSKWAVPVLVIAKNRAKAYAHEYGGDESLSLSEDTKPLFESDDFEIEDWAQNNMNWSDVKESATMITGPTPVDFDEGWMNGEHCVS